MQVPGFLWTALLALIPLLVQWFGGDYFAGQSWAPWAIMALGFVAKAIEMAHQSQGASGVHIVGERDMARKRSRVSRFLLG